MKIALIHDHLIQDGGAEHVLRVLQEIWPDAPTYTLIHDRERAHPAFRDREIRTSFLQKMPLARSHYQWYLPLMPHATESHNLSDFELVISSSSAFSKGVITRPDTLHICYCHTPTRYLWSDTHAYIEELSASHLIKTILPLTLTRLRLWDRLAAERVDRFVANSNNVAGRIKKYYHREADVIHPPVNTSLFSIAPKTENFYLVGGRLVSYKRFDIVVRAFANLGIPLKIFGVGPMLSRLQALAKPNIEFLGWVDDQTRSKLYAQCLAFLHPHEEDFGITAIEAQAAGRPVIALAKGGALETVLPGVTGQFIHEQEWETLADTIIRFKPEQFNPEQIRQNALRFDTSHFKEKFQRYIKEAYQSFTTVTNG